jgi:hypothetical protein
MVMAHCGELMQTLSLQRERALPLPVAIELPFKLQSIAASLDSESANWIGPVNLRLQPQWLQKRFPEANVHKPWFVQIDSQA